MTQKSPRLIGTLALGLLCSGCADWFLMFPRQGRMATSAERRAFETKHGTLEVYVHGSGACGPRRPAVLEFVGNASRAEYSPIIPTSAWCRRPAFVWRVNYPGFGGSDGSGSIREIPAAALAAYDALTKEHEGCPIVLVGNSMGTTAAMYLGQERPVRGVVLKNPPALKEVILLEWGWWNAFVAATVVALQVPDRLDSRKNAMRSSAPTLYISSEADWLVPFEIQTLLYDAHRGPKQRVILKGAGHNAHLFPYTPGLKAGLRWMQGCR